MATSSPSTPLIQPLSGLPCAVIVPQIRIPKTDRRKNSHEANFRAHVVSTGVSVNTKMTLMKVPKKLAVVASMMARPPSPLRAMGKPSSAVAAEAGVPGIFSRMADWQPPEIDPT